MQKSLTKKLLIPIAIYIIILSLLILERINSHFPIEILYLIIFALIYTLPSIMILILEDSREKADSEKPQENFIKRNGRKIFSYTLISVFIWYALVLLMPDNPLGYPTDMLGFVYIIAPFVLLMAFIFHLILSYVLSKIAKSKVGIILPIASICLLLVVGILTAKYISRCGLFGCGDAQNMAQKAYENKDPKICARMISGQEASKDIRFSFSGHNIHQTKNNCLIKYAELAGDNNICGLVEDYMKDMCPVFKR